MTTPTEEPLNDPAKRSATAKRLAREHAQRAALRATKQAMSAAAEQTDPPFAQATGIEPLNDSVRAELDAWAEYRGQLDAPAYVKVAWREAMTALSFDEPALAQWRIAVREGWR